MPTTTPHGLTIPVIGDAPNGAVQIAALGNDVDTKLLTGGKSIIATSQTRTSSSYGKLTTADEVTGVVVPTDGIVEVIFQAMWNQSTAVAANAAIFIDAVQLQASYHAGATDPSVAVTGTGTSNGIDHWLTSYPNGLFSDVGTGAATPSSPVTTGQVLGTATTSVNQGGAVRIGDLAAGTYTISVQFKTAGGTLTVKNRKLWVRAVTF